MKAFFAKSVMAASLVTAMFASASAGAATYNEFTINPNPVALNPGLTNPYDPFTAARITGTYSEVITFNQDGTFDVSLRWTAGQFVDNNGNEVLSGLGGSEARDPAIYGLYALYSARGQVSAVTDINGVTTTSFLFTGPGSLDVYYDENNNTVVANNGTPSDGTDSWDLLNTSDDTKIAFGSALTGAGTFQAIGTCGTGKGINCGSFGSTTSFELTEVGKQFFVGPNPFYNLSFQSGQLNDFPLTGTQVINGSLDVVFQNGEVPEPASLGLLGLGLLGLSAARRRKQAK